jgi:hypothetical protein
VKGLRFPRPGPRGRIKCRGISAKADEASEQESLGHSAETLTKLHAELSGRNRVTLPDRLTAFHILIIRKRAGRDQRLD